MSSLIIITLFILFKYIHSIEVYCEEKIYEENSVLSASQLNSLCELISADPRFVISLPYKKFVDDLLYYRDNKEFFEKVCSHLENSSEDYKYLCTKGFSISVYNNNINTLTIYYKNSDKGGPLYSKLASIILELKRKNNIFDAIKSLILNIQAIDPTTIGSDNSTTTKTEEEINREQNRFSFFLFLLVVVIPLLFLSTVIYFMTRMISQYPEDQNTPTAIHEYFSKIVQIELQLEESKEIKLEKCILCLSRIVPQYKKVAYEMQEINSRESLLPQQVEIPVDDINVRFNCGHVYHGDCLRKRGINFCVMCFDKQEEGTTIFRHNRSSVQKISKKNIIQLILNFDKIYQKEDIEHYNRIFGDELPKMKDKFLKSELKK